MKLAPSKEYRATVEDTAYGLMEYHSSNADLLRSLHFNRTSLLIGEMSDDAKRELLLIDEAICHLLLDA